MMANSKEDPKPRRVIDVTEPGKSEPSASGRPIIVTNRPLLKQDPMMVSNVSVDSDIGDTPSGETPQPVGDISADHQGSTVLPPTAPKLPKETTKNSDAPVETTDDETKTVEADDDKPVTNDKDEPAATTSTADTDDKPIEESTDTEPAKPETSETSSDEVESKDSVTEPDTQGEKTGAASNDEQLAPNKVLDEAAKKVEEAKAAQLAEIEKLIESKRYFLPINTVERRRDAKRAILLLVVVILFALIWLDLALDAGLLKLGHIHSLTHFFSS
jgi:hypothetical protein